MKMRLALAALCVAGVAGGIPGTAHPKDVPVTQQRAHESMANDANASAQANTDMSYGGVQDTHSMSGTVSRTGKMCWPRPTCDVFFGQ
jgi:hypothetical protein